MKNGDPALRSYALIERTDLLRLLELARSDRQDFFARHPAWARYYADRVLGTALCQGAALHYVNPSVGINDFDVYTFYAANPDRRWYAKRLRSVDFGIPKFGRSEISRKPFVGRRVDLLARSLEVPTGTDVRAAIQSWLVARPTATARELAAKAIVLLEPTEHLGTVIWPTVTMRT